jgi:hypothetical protein
MGLVVLAGVFPFCIYWLTYLYKFEGLTNGTFNQIVLAAAVLYVVDIFYSIKYIVKQPENVITLNRPFKLVLTFLPILLLITWGALFFIR